MSGFGFESETSVVRGGGGGGGVHSAGGMCKITKKLAGLGCGRALENGRRRGGCDVWATGRRGGSGMRDNPCCLSPAHAQTLPARTRSVHVTHVGPAQHTHVVHNSARRIIPPLQRT